MTETITKIEAILENGEYAIKDDGIVIAELSVPAEIIEYIVKK